MAEEYQREIAAFNKALPDPNTANSAADILLDQIKPRLPASGTISVLVASDVPLTVPTADATTNTNERDVVGNKTDAAVKTVGTTKSIIAYIKGVIGLLGAPAGVSHAADIAVIDSYHDVPTANATTDTVIRDVIGRKTDAAVTDVGTTKSLMAYLKGLIQELDQRKIAKVAIGQTTNGLTGTGWTSLLNITDKGVLTGVSQIYCPTGTANLFGGIKIIVDGITIMTDDCFTYAKYVNTYDPYVSGSNNLAFNHRFNTSLAVSHCHTGGDGTAVVYSKVAYTIDD